MAFSTAATFTGSCLVLILALAVYQSEYGEFEPITSPGGEYDLEIVDIAPNPARCNLGPQPSPSGKTVVATFRRNGGGDLPSDIDGVAVRVRADDPLGVVAGIVAERLGYSRGDSFRVFSCSGVQVTSFKDLGASPMLYIVPVSDHWIWPAVKVGHVAEVDVGLASGPVELVTISVSPKAFSIRNFLSEAEMSEIIGKAEPSLKTSGVYEGSDASASEKVVDGRSSEQAWLEDDGLVTDVSLRTEVLLRIPRELSEQLQVVHYGPGGHYHGHYDYFPPANYPDREDLQRGRNRLATVIFYLNDVEAGGRTALICGPYGACKATVADYCSPSAVGVEPDKGSALVFYSMYAWGHMRGSVDSKSLHAGCDVLAGEKWIANKWFYNMQA